MKSIVEILTDISRQKGYGNRIYALANMTQSEIDKMLAEAAEIYANQSRWVSVADRLPENRSYVLSFSPNYNNVAGFKHGCFFDGLERLYNVTHWQPLPENP